MTERNKNNLAWVLMLVAAIIMLQTLLFKFSGVEESVYLPNIGVQPSWNWLARV